MTQQSGGAGIPLTQAVAGVLSGSILAPAFATNGTTPLFGTLTNQLAAPVTMTNANTYYDGPSLALSIGAWLLVGHVRVSGVAAGGTVMTGKLWDGTTALDGAESDVPQNLRAMLSFVGVYVAASPATVKISCACINAGAVIQAAASFNNPGNILSTLTALRIA